MVRQEQSLYLEKVSATLEIAAFTLSKLSALNAIESLDAATASKDKSFTSRIVISYG